MIEEGEATVSRSLVSDNPGTRKKGHLERIDTW